MQQQDFRNEFMQRRRGKPGGINVSILRFTTCKKDPKIKLFCFVEGNSDIVFYSGVIPDSYRLKPEQVQFIINQDSLHDNKEYNLHGKRSVIKMCDYIVAEHTDSLPKCKFIVDRDYDDLDLEKYNVSNDVTPHVTILPCYSFENYYFIDENLKSILRIVFGSMEYLHYNEFLKILFEFLSQSCEYSALKKLIVKFSLHKRYVKQLSLALDFKEELHEFLINDGGKITLNLEPLQHVAYTAKTLFSEITDYESKLLLFSYEQYCVEMRNDPLSVKGKLIFDLLIKYINYNSNEHYSANDLYRYSRYLTCPGLD